MDEVKLLKLGAGLRRYRNRSRLVSPDDPREFRGGHRLPFWEVMLSRAERGERYAIDVLEARHGRRRESEA